MGRVARYKKVRAVDPFSKSNNKNNNSGGGGDSVGGGYIWGMGNDGRKAKKRSKTSEKLREAKLKRRMSNNMNPNNPKNNKRNNMDNDDTNKSNKKARWNEFNAAPDDDDDDFDINDMVNTIKKDKDMVLDIKEEQQDVDMSIIANNHNDQQQHNELKDVICHSEKDNEIGDNRTEVQRQQQPPITELSCSAGSTSGSVSMDQSKKSSKKNNDSKLLKVEDEKLNQKLQEQVLKQQKEKSNIAVTSLDRKIGESKNAYRKRVQSETRVIMKQSIVNTNTNPERKARKKEFLKEKKNKNKKNKFQSNNDNDDDDDDDDDNEELDTNNSKKDKITDSSSVLVRSRTAIGPQFGEQVLRPPTITQLPRGAIPNKKQQKMNTINNQKPKINQEEMELLRRKVQAQYALIRSQRQK